MRRAAEGEGIIKKMSYKLYPKWLAILVMIPLVFYLIVFIFGVIGKLIIFLTNKNDPIGNFAELSGAIFGLILFYWLSKKNYLYIKKFKK